LKKIKLALGIHNHQPVGNFDFVFEEAYKKAYLPFLETLANFPNIKLAQHYTGILFEWILERYPEFIERLKVLVQQGQIEMMTGGFYEPILINIPDEDKRGQILKLTEFVKQHTGYDPSGLWLAERIWEPQLPKPLALANIKYTVIDDSHFKSAGLKEENLYGYYLTEDTGFKINIFPISEKLRYTIPFQDPEVTIDYLRSIATEEGNRLLVFADDGEKFGIWPGTFTHCYEHKWLERFFSALEANLDWIEIVHFSEVLTQLAPLGQIYLPTASYREMMEWALPTKAIHEYENFERELKAKELFDNYKVFVRGGFWRNFLAKYPESNNLHKKSLYVSDKISSLNKKVKNDNLFQQAHDLLWAGQCNCPYWHGVFGGLYLNNLRYAVYKSMIQAETLVDQLTKTEKQLQQGWIDVQQTDFNADGSDELIVETKLLNLYLAPHKGGSLFEIDYKPKAINLLDTMSRREEGYHRKLLAINKNHNQGNDQVTSIHDMVISKEENLDKMLFYDWYERKSLIDHFLHPDTTIQSMANSSYKEAGDFIVATYDLETKQEKTKLNILLEKEGTVLHKDKQHKISIQKTITVPANSSELFYRYQLTNLENKPVELWFAIEFNFALLAGNAPDRYYYFQNKQIENPILASTGIVENTTFMGLKDEWLKLDIQLKFKKAATVWRFPIETISQSEGGFERVYQSSVVLPNWKFTLPTAEKWEVTINQKIIEF